MRIGYKCDMLLDQGRYINGEAIGHRCLNNAITEYTGYLMCESCIHILRKQPWRITVPIIGGRQYQDGIDRAASTVRPK